jgi:hypothetical protein
LASPKSEWSDGRAPRGARPSVAKSVPIDGVVVALRVGGIARRRDELEILGFHGALAHEFLDAPTTDRLSRVEIALRVNGHHVQEGEIPGHVSGTAEPGEDRVGYVIEDPHDLVAAVGDVHELLAIVRRKVDVPRGPGGPDLGWHWMMDAGHRVEHAAETVSIAAMAAVSWWVLLGFLVGGAAWFLPKGFGGAPIPPLLSVGRHDPGSLDD